MTITQAISPTDIALSRQLFGEYAAWLGIDLSFQGFASELEELPGAYATPRGRLLLAHIGGQPAGCVALRPLEGTVCEMKRLFVRIGFRGRGVGRSLAERVVEEARAIGYRNLRLDTLAGMEPAICLYQSIGFLRRGPYYETPLANTVFMELAL